MAAIDTSIMLKSGKKTFGKGNFWSTSLNRAIKGIEISSIALIHLKTRQAFNISVRQTNGKKSDEDSRMNQYIHQFNDVVHWLKKLNVLYVVADGFYAKYSFVRTILQNQLHLISRLRNDANLRWPYQGPHPKRRGAKRKYEGKVSFSQMDKFRKITDYNRYLLFEALVYSISFKRTIKVVMVRPIDKPNQYALLFSTSILLPALYVVQYYEARYQIEFLFRDGKQHLGLADCQSTQRQRLDAHFNFSMAALNIAKLHILERNSFKPDTVISIDNSLVGT